MWYTLAYITGGIIIALALMNFIFPSRKISLFIKASLDGTTILNNLFIYFATNNPLIIAGIVTNAIATVRDIIYFNRNNSKVFNNIAWPIGFAIIMGCSLIFTYKSPISIIPVIGSVVSTLVLYANDQRITKCCSLFATACYITYYAILVPQSDVLTIFTLISASANFIGTTIGIIILFRKIKKEKELSLNNSSSI